MEEVDEDVQAAVFCLDGFGILFLVDNIFVGRFCDELLDFVLLRDVSAGLVSCERCGRTM